VRLKAGVSDIQSPNYNSEDKAKADLEAISKGQKEGEHIGLPWLSVDGDDVLVAQLSARVLLRGG
jgi:hypothetical protein